VQEGSDWIPAAVELLQKRLALEPADALTLASCAQANRRDLGYLVNLLTYIEQTPEIRQPAAVFRRLVIANQVPRPRPSSAAIADRISDAEDSNS
jgi:hypothetical protein